MMRRRLFLLILGVLWSIFFILLVSCREGQRNVGEASPESQIRLIVKSGELIPMRFFPVSDGTPIRVVSGKMLYYDTLYMALNNGELDLKKYHADGDTMVIYGDVAFCQLDHTLVRKIVSKNPSLLYLNFLHLDTDLDEEGILESVDIQASPLLQILVVMHSNLKSLDISKNSYLRELECSYNGNLSEIVWGNNFFLEELRCKDCNLSTLAFRSVSLQYLDCSNNRIRELDLAQVGGIKKLRCSNNRLEKLEIPERWRLELLDCEKNEIRELDLSNSYRLTHLYCRYNPLISLNLEKTPELKSENVYRY